MQREGTVCIVASLCVSNQQKLVLLVHSVAARLPVTRNASVATLLSAYQIRRQRCRQLAANCQTNALCSCCLRLLFPVAQLVLYNADMLLPSEQALLLLLVCHQIQRTYLGHSNIAPR